MDLALLVVLLVLISVLAGLVGSLVGLGGAVVMIPVLLVFFGVSVPDAIGTGAITILATSSSSGAAYVRDRLSDLRIGMFLEIATVPGALIGATLTVFLTHADLTDGLLVALGVVLLAVVPGSLRGPKDESAAAHPPDDRSVRLHLEGTYLDRATGAPVHYRAAETTPALGVMFGAGLVSGTFGIGAGVFKVFALEHYLRLPMKVSTATSNFMMGVTAAAGAGVLFAAGYVNPLIAGPVAIGTAVGAYVGSRILPRLHNQTIRWIFAPVVVILAVETILRGLGVL